VALNLQIKLAGLHFKINESKFYNLRLLPWVGPQPQQLSPSGDLNIVGNEVSNQGGTSFGPNPLPAYRRAFFTESPVKLLVAFPVFTFKI
jgi:hypothetical protein